ncbi:cation diffusion facilitator family transporter [Halorubrum sp. N11]|uniref:cation diffusion facilitator family transporter n=1 Tax=Halorubrum sp. N11 TaxID=3402276 RepID=UPI003EBA4936
MAGSRSVVIAALFANGAIAIMKGFAFLLTGSPSMLSETYHSISDTGNQVFLLLGIRFSKQAASQSHPFGYGKAQFFYAFLVSVLLFGIAGWESLKHGYGELTAPAGAHAGQQADVILAGINFTDLVPVETFWVSVVVLLGAIAFETYAFKKAWEELARQIERYEWSGIREAFSRTADVTTLTAFTEDAIALGGAVIALVGITLTRITGIQAFDQISAILIGILLMGFALALAWQNKRLLLGESLPKEVEDEFRTAINENTGVRHVDGLRSMFVGPTDVLVTADVSFNSSLDTSEIDEVIGVIETDLSAIDSRVEMVYMEPQA